METPFLAYFSYFEKNESRVMSHNVICIPVPEPIFMKLRLYIMAPEPISKAYFINPSHQSVCLYAYPPIVAR
jgi:hypothetical protein